jgi:hypothetical protein
MSERLTLQDFAPHLHSRFRVEHPGNHEVELTEITDRSSQHIEQFSLVFTGRASPWLPQGTYRLIHPQLRERDLFLVPIGPDAAGMRYEAVFSRPAQPVDA